MKKLLLFTLTFLLIISCNKDDDSGTSKFNELDHFYQNANELRIEIAYEVGAEPYINSGSTNYWDFSEKNLEALFDGRSNPIAVNIPKQLNQMNEIPNQGKSSYTSNDLRELASTYQIQESDAEKSVVFLLFLDGYFNRNGEEQTNFLGVSVGNFVVAVFKPVVESIPTGVFNNPRPSIEQGTVVHEIGHALGLVNGGVDMVEDHHDVQNGEHCTNQDCVMYWLNEGATDMSNFVTGGLFGGSEPPIVFGSECLNDTRNYLN